MTGEEAQVGASGKGTRQYLEHEKERSRLGRRIIWGLLIFILALGMREALLELSLTASYGGKRANEAIAELAREARMPDVEPPTIRTLTQRRHSDMVPMGDGEVSPLYTAVGASDFRARVLQGCANLVANGNIRIRKCAGEPDVNFELPKERPYITSLHAETPPGSGAAIVRFETTWGDHKPAHEHEPRSPAC